MAILEGLAGAAGGGGAGGILEAGKGLLGKVKGKGKKKKAKKGGEAGGGGGGKGPDIAGGVNKVLDMAKGFGLK